MLILPGAECYTNWNKVREGQRKHNQSKLGQLVRALWKTFFFSEQKKRVMASENEQDKPIDEEFEKKRWAVLDKLICRPGPFAHPAFTPGPEVCINFFFD